MNWLTTLLPAVLGGLLAGTWIKLALDHLQRVQQEKERAQQDEEWAQPIDHIVVTGGGLGSPKTLRIDGDQFLTGATHDLDHGTLTLNLMASTVEVVYADTLASWDESATPLEGADPAVLSRANLDTLPHVNVAHTSQIYLDERAEWCPKMYDGAGRRVKFDD